MAAENDIVLIHFEDQPLTFARIEQILPDNKPDWFHVKLLMLQVPLQVVTWILRDRYIMGDEFTMNGKRMRLEKIVCPQTVAGDEETPQDDNDQPTVPSNGPGTVISLKDKRRR